jgi:DNA-binding PadR family transcriptional regulator
MVAWGEASGYELARSAARGVGYIWAPSRSQIYKVLARLAEWALVRCRDVEQRGRPDKALYRITRDGRMALRAWVENVEDDPAGGASVFLLKILYGWVAPDEAVLAQLDAYRARLERAIAHFEELERGLPANEPVHSLIAVRHALTRGRATLDWIEEARRHLTAKPSRRTPRRTRT